jgi:hemolysin activation/secretion protein
VTAVAVLFGPWAARAELPFGGNTIPQGSPIARVLPSPPPPVSAGGAAGAPAAAHAVPDATAAVRVVQVAGATAFPPARMAALLQGLVGPAVPLRRIELARTALVGLYRSHGFVLTTVNAEIAAGAVLRFEVVEGHITDVRLDGEIGPAGAQVLRFLRHLTAISPLDNASLERWVLLAQDVPGVRLRAVLRPSGDGPGALTLVAQVARTAVSGLLSADNRASPLTGPQEALLVADLNSVTALGERTEVSIYHTDGDTQTFGQASEEFFVGGSGLRMRLVAGYGTSTPSGYLRAIDYEGLTTTFGIAAIYPLIRARQQTLEVTVNLDAIEAEIRTIGGRQFEQTRASRDSYRVARLAGAYVRGDTVFGAGRPATDTVTMRVSRGAPLLGGMAGDTPDPGRADERLDFTAVNAAVTRAQTVCAPWPEARVVLQGKVLGQVTGDILPPGEEFFLGGSDIDRGFYAGQVTGDQGLAESAELQLNTLARFAPWGKPAIVTAQYYVFYDHGQTWQNSRADPDGALASEGLGARFGLTRYAEFDLEGDVRTTRLPSGKAGVVRPLKADALYWRVEARF